MLPEISESDLVLLSKVANGLKRTLPPHVDFEDLIQWGYFGLAEAHQRFDPERGLKFGTYASPRIRRAMLDGLREYDWAPRLARKRREEVPAMQSIQLLTAPRSNRQHSFDLPDRRPPKEPELEDRDAFERSLAFLHGDMKRVILLNFREDKNLREIGEIMGLSESRVSQIRAQAFRILRAKIVGPRKRMNTPRCHRRYSRTILACDELPGRTFTMKEAAAEAGVSKTSIHCGFKKRAHGPKAPFISPGRCARANPRMILSCTTYWKAGVTHDSHLYLPTLDGRPMPLAIRADTEGWVEVYVMRGDLVDCDAFGAPRIERLYGRVRLKLAPEFFGPGAAPINGQGMPHQRPAAAAATPPEFANFSGLPSGMSRGC